jgi:hypothetical protein
MTVATKWCPNVSQRMVVVAPSGDQASGDCLQVGRQNIGGSIGGDQQSVIRRTNTQVISRTRH